MPVLEAKFEIVPVPVTRVRRGVRGPRKLVVKADLLERVEFEPDNSRIGRESRGLQSARLVSAASCGYDLDKWARAIVDEWYELSKNTMFARQSMVCTIV